MNTLPSHYVQSNHSSYTILPMNTTDETLIEMWLHGKATTTQRAYTGDIDRFRTFVSKPLREVTLADFQDFATYLHGLDLESSSIARPIRAVKSLLSFAYKTGYTRFNVGTLVYPPKVKDTLAERILSEEQVMRMIHMEPNHRNQVMLRLLYVSAVRVSELCDLCWRDVSPRGDGAGQITVFGKGEKTRAILLTKETYQELESLRNGATGDMPIFRSRGGGKHKGGGSLDPSQVLRIVRATAKRAGIDALVSPHWLRHSHATHAQEHGAPIALVQKTLGHESIKTTAKYSHVRPGESSAAYLRM